MLKYTFKGHLSGNKLHTIKPLTPWLYPSHHKDQWKTALVCLRPGYTRDTHGFLMVRDVPLICLHCHVLDMVQYLLVNYPKFHTSHQLVFPVNQVLHSLTSSLFSPQILFHHFQTKSSSWVWC